MHIDILGMKYKITYVDADTFSDSTIFGMADPKKCVIYLSKDMPPAMLDSTLLHEIIRMISDSLGLNLSEKQVLGLESGLRTVIKIKIIRKAKKGAEKNERNTRIPKK
jgi:hypothetical protein